jgi:translation elongation factor EF-Tu-like GTPase
VQLLAKVDDVFTISGRGVVVVPIWLSELKIKVGDSVQLRTPGGQVRNTRIAGVEMAKQVGGCRAAFMLARDIAKEDVVQGTEIWVSDVSAV